MLSLALHRHFSHGFRNNMGLHFIRHIGVLVFTLNHISSRLFTAIGGCYLGNHFANMVTNIEVTITVLTHLLKLETAHAACCMQAYIKQVDCLCRRKFIDLVF